MKNIFLIIVITFLTLSAQTTEQIKKQLKDAGITPDQAIQTAKDRGMTAQQIESEAQARGIEIESATLDKSAIESSIGSQVELELEESTVPKTPEKELDEEKEELVLETTDISEREATFYFGYNIFEGDPSVFQASTFGRVDPNYNIGPMDQIVVMLWGEAQFRNEYIVNRKGNIFIDGLGPVSVKGLTLKSLEKKFFQIFSKLYSTLNPIAGQPTTFMDISLGSLRPLRVIILGEVAQPGAYTVSPSTSLSSVLYYFRGPTTMGSLRDIRLIRQGKTMGSLDFYDYLLSGKTPNDLRLQIDDIVFIPPRGKTVAISGEINRPAIYELKDGEMLADLIKIAGDLRVTTYMDRAQIDRIVAPELRDELGMDRMLVDINLGEILRNKDDYPVRDGDTITLFSILNLRENTVTISGAVVRPGTYDLGDGKSLKDLIQQAKGLLGDVYLERVDVVRINPDFTKKLIKLNIQDVMADSVDQNLLLQPMDHIKLYSLTDMVARQNVSITGYVQYPGEYPLFKNMNLYDLVFNGGGLADDEWLDQAFMERADLIRFNKDNISSRVIPFNLGELINNPANQNINWPLESGDIARIYSKRIFNVAKPVTIDGAVVTPGEYKYKTNMTIKDLILEAGGVSKNVYQYKIEVARVDPLNTNKNIYAQLLSLDMNNDFSLSNFQYQYGSNPGELSVKREEFELFPYDRISIRPNPNFSIQRTVKIVGEINYPGTYSLTRPKEKVSDIIRRSGGLNDEAYPLASVLIRNDQVIKVSIADIIKNEWSKDNFELLDGDEIIINAHPNIVKMVGEVNAPGNYKYYSNKTLRGYINLAGGLTVNAESREIRVTYPNGTSKQLKRFRFAPKVYDGSVITVGREEEIEPIDKTEFAKEVSSIIADFLQIYITLVLLWNTAITT